MDIQILKTFIEVSKMRHFGQAAKNLFLTQAAVSARIKLLEDKLGAALFIRKRNNIQLTQAGNRLLEHADNLVKGWERAALSVALGNEPGASISAGCLFDLWHVMVEDWAKKLLKQSPAIALQLDIQPAKTLGERLSQGLLDLAFVFDPPQLSHLDQKQIGHIRLRLVSTIPNLTPNHCLENNYILVDWGSSFEIAHSESFPDTPAPMIRTNSAQIALKLLLEQGGSAYLPDEIIHSELKEGRLHIATDSPTVDKPIYAVYSPDNLTNDTLKLALAAVDYPER